MDLNVTAQFLLLQKCLPLLERTDEKASPSRVINITSINGEQIPDLETYAYSTSKAALKHLTKHVASRLAPKGILVNNIAPGPFQSRMMRGTIAAAGEEVVADQCAIPKLGSPANIGAACLYLAGPGGDWITGTTILVDGGTLVKTALSRM